MANRAPLTPVNSNIIRYKELDPVERAYILALHRAGWKGTAIAAELNRSPQTVYTTIRRKSPQPSLASNPRSGRPKSTSDLQKRSIV